MLLHQSRVFQTITDLFYVFLKKFQARFFLILLKRFIKHSPETFCRREMIGKTIQIHHPSCKELLLPGKQGCLIAYY